MFHALPTGGIVATCNNDQYITMDNQQETNTNSNLQRLHAKHFNRK